MEPSPTPSSNQECDSGEVPSMGSAQSPDFEASDTLSQATWPQEGPRIGQKLGQMITRLFVPNGAQDEAPTTLSNQECDSGEVLSMGSAKCPDFEASDTLSQATDSQEGPRIGQKLGQVITRLFVPNGAQDEAPTPSSNQESDSGEVLSM